MITAFMAVNDQQANELHAVYVIRREGITKIRAMGFCSIEGDAGPGVFQVPAWAFDGRPKFGPPGGENPVCVRCGQIVTALKDPPR